MKKNRIALAMALLAFLSPAAVHAAEGHDHKKEAAPKKEHAGHDHAKKTAGPNGGRVVTSVEPHFEFLVMPDRKVKITFLGEDGKAVPVAEQTVKLTGGDRAKPTELAFTKEGTSLISDKPLPEGKVVQVALRIKASEKAETVTERISVNLAKCPTCEHLEYACTCDHSEDGHSHGDGHDHKH